MNKSERIIEMKIFKLSALKIALNLNYVRTTLPNFCQKSSLLSWLSGQRRQTIQIVWPKVGVGPGIKIFFFFFQNFDLRSKLVFPLCFKAYVTFL